MTLRAAEAGEASGPVIEHLLAGSAVALPQPVDKVLSATTASDKAAGASAEAALSPYRQLLSRSYTLPDGSTVQVHSAAARAVDALYDVTPVRELVHGSVNLQRLYVDACVVLDPLSRAAAVNNTLLIGGLSQIPGMWRWPCTSGSTLCGGRPHMCTRARLHLLAMLTLQALAFGCWGNSLTWTRLQAWCVGSGIVCISRACTGAHARALTSCSLYCREEMHTWCPALP